MNDVMNAINDVRKTSGNIAKETLLKSFSVLSGFKEVLQFVYDPYIRTGIARAKLNRVEANEDVYIDFDYIIEHFTENQTGTTADAIIAKSFINQFEGDHAIIAEGIVTKTLKIGVTAKTLNKIYGSGFIPLIGIMRAESYDDFKHKVEGPFIVTEKIDGARRLLVKENGKVTMYSRSGIPDDGLVDIMEEAYFLPDNCVFDGELKAIGIFDNALELRQATNSLANRKGVRKGLTYNLFDMIPINDYKRGISLHTALNRKLMLAGLFGDESIECLNPRYKEIIEDFELPYDFKYIQPIPIEGIAYTEEEVLMLTEPIWARGFEGTMLNTFGGKYDITKTKSREILKVKRVEEYALRVIDMELGKPGTKNEHILGSLIVDYKGYRVGVGMGIDDAKRNDWWENPSKIIGKFIEVECYGESTNMQGGLSLNCAVFKRIVGDE